MGERRQSTSHDQIHFSPFRLDLSTERLWRGAKALYLRPLTFAVLRHLVERAGQIVAKEELLNTLWPDIHGRELLLKGRIRELRQVLRDDAKAPRFIETIGRQGYRWVAETRGLGLEASPPPSQVSSL